MKVPTIICKRIDAKKKPDGGQRRYTLDLTAYMGNPEAKNGDEKCIATFGFGFTRPDVSPREAAAELNMDCELVHNPRSNLLDHWVMSFSDTGADISAKKIESTVQGWLTDMGYGKYHKAFCAIHADTDNTHVHVALCRVNFLNGKLKWRQMWKLDNQAALTRAAKAEGWRLEEGSDYFTCPRNTRPEPVIVKDPVFGTEEKIYRPTVVRQDRRKIRELKHPGDKASRMEHFGRMKTEKTLIAERVKGVLDDLPEKPGWLDAHLALARRGVQMDMRIHGKRRGIVLSLDGVHWMGASRISRVLSWKPLSKRVGGEFLPASPELFEGAELEKVLEIIRVLEDARKAGFKVEREIVRDEPIATRPGPAFRSGKPVAPQSAEQKARQESLKKRRAHKDKPVQTESSPERVKKRGPRM